MKTCDYCGRKNSDEVVCCSGCGRNDVFKADAPPELPKLDAQDEFVTLATCQNLPAADQMVTCLDAAGIEAFVPDESLMQWLPFFYTITFGFIRVQVRRKDLSRAQELLSDAEPEGPRSPTN